MFDSLRSRLLFWLLVPLALVAVVDAWTSLRSARDISNIVQERMLLGSARMIGQQVHLEEGVVQVIVPPAALELFASPSRDHVFYRISTQDGQTLAGYFDFVAPPRALGPEDAVYYDTEFRGQPVHAVAFAQPVFAAPDQGPVLIQVGQTLDGRRALERDIWSRSVSGQVAMFALAGLILWFGMRRGLRPLLDLRDQLSARKPGTLDRMNPRGMPAEARPLVGVVNDYVERLDAHMSAHSRFISDASHQLRTPLTLLATQVNFALQRGDGADRTEALNAMRECVQHSVRLVNQLLTFDMAQSGIGRTAVRSEVDLDEVVRRAVEDQAGVAARRGIDLGLEAARAPALVMANPTLLYEMVANLLDNALRYTPPGGIVTAAVVPSEEGVELRIADNGPGIPEEERENVFQRFYRLDNRKSDGCGLGLAIVREIADSCGATVGLEGVSYGTGLLVRVRFARQAAPDLGRHAAVGTLQ